VSTAPFPPIVSQKPFFFPLFSSSSCFFLALPTLRNGLTIYIFFPIRHELCSFPCRSLYSSLCLQWTPLTVFWGTATTIGLPTSSRWGLLFFYTGEKTLLFFPPATFQPRFFSRLKRTNFFSRLLPLLPSFVAASPNFSPWHYDGQPF